MRAKDYRELIVWRKAHTLAVAVYKYTAHFPKDERFALTDQMRRSAMSVPSNIVEGFERSSNKEFRHFSRSRGARPVRFARS